MDTSPIPVNSAPIIDSNVKQGVAWIRRGWRLVRKHRSLWFGMTVVYFALGFLLKLIPFMGDLLLILVTPMLLASVVWGRVPGNQAIHANGSRRALSRAQAMFQTWAARPAQELVHIFTVEDRVFGAVLLGIVTLGLAMSVKIVGYLLIGGSMISGLTAGQLSAPQITTVLGILVIAILYLMLAMGLIYSVPLTVLGNRQPFSAIAESFSVCRRYPVALLALTVPFFMVYLLIMTAFAKFHWLGYVLVISAGFVAVPVFVASVYSSYLTFYPVDQTTSPQ